MEKIQSHRDTPETSVSGKARSPSELVAMYFPERANQEIPPTVTFDPSAAERTWVRIPARPTTDRAASDQEDHAIAYEPLDIPCPKCHNMTLLLEPPMKIGHGHGRSRGKWSLLSRIRCGECDYVTWRVP